MKTTKFKFDDRVKVVSPEYSYIASVGEKGTIVDHGYKDNIIGQYRYLVQWDKNPNRLWGVYDGNIEHLEIQAE